MLLELPMEWTVARGAQARGFPLPFPPPRAKPGLSGGTRLKCATGSAFIPEFPRPGYLLARPATTGPALYQGRRMPRASWKGSESEGPVPYPEGARGPRPAGAAGAALLTLSAVAAQVRYRPAAAEDLGTIQRMVLSEAMNPLSLDWRRFLVAEAAGAPGEAQARAGAGSWSIVGIGQIKRWDSVKGSSGVGTGGGGGEMLELRSLVVAPSHRGQGVGSEIVKRLLERAAGGNGASAPNQDGVPVYLLTIGKRVEFYERLGFQEVSEASQVPPQLRFELQAGTWVARLVAQDRCLCMKLSL